MQRYVVSYTYREEGDKKMKKLVQRLKMVKYFGWRGAFDKNFIRLGD